MNKPPLDYQTRYAASTIHWTRRPVYWLLFVAPSLPLVLLLIPHSFTIMSEPTDPWYTPYTTPLALLTFFYLSPATVISQLLGIRPTSPGWIVITLLYTGLIGWALCSFISRPRRM